MRRATCSNFLGLMAIVLAVFALNAAPASADEYWISNVVSQMQVRLLGRILLDSDPITTQMKNTLRADTSDAGLQAAARIATTHPAFANRVLRDYYAPMQVLSGSPVGVPMNNAILLAIAQTLQPDANPSAPEGVRRIFYANQTCFVPNPNPTASPSLVDPSTLTEAQLAALDLHTQITCTTGQQSVNAAGTVGTTPANEAMGMFTVGGPSTFAETVFTAGTNLRFGLVFLQSTLGQNFTLQKIRTSAFPDNYVGVYVTRDPNGLGVAEYQTNCVSCHGWNNAIVPCFNWSYNPAANNNKGMVGYEPNPPLNPTTKSPLYNKCQGSDPTNNKNIYPYGYKRSTNEFVIEFTPTQLQQIGWNAPMEGYGMNTLGTYWSQTQQVYRNLIDKVINGTNGVCIGITLDPTMLENAATQLKADGNLVNQFVTFASNRQCLGI